MMKILLVCGPGISLKEPYDSGIEAFIVSFANQLIENGHIVEVLAAKAGAHAKFTLVNPFDEIDKESVHAKQELIEQRQFENLDLTRYDIIHYNMFYPHLLESGMKFKIPSFLTLHSPADEKRIAAYRKISQSSNLIFIAISDRVKQQWDQALDKDVALVYNGIDMNRWPITNAQDRSYLLWSARINTEKNVAAAIALAQHLRLPLKIAGRIVDKKYFEMEVRPHLNSEVQYIGHLTQLELSELARGARAYLATATWPEPFGLAALEMLATGIPVIGFSTAVPPNWKHPSVMTTESTRWQDLIELVEKSDTVAPELCRAFASDMTIELMTSSYTKIYQETLMKDGTNKESKLKCVSKLTVQENGNDIESGE